MVEDQNFDPEREYKDPVLANARIKIETNKRKLTMGATILYTYCGFMVLMGGLFATSAWMEKPFNIEHLTAIGTFLSPLAALAGTIVTHYYTQTPEKSN